MDKNLSIDSALSNMNKYRGVYKKKGTYGEKAVLALLQDYQKTEGGVIIHSFSYNYAQKFNGENYFGNIHLENGKFVEIRGQSYTKDEIDIVYVTKYRIFAIECKARGGTWKIYDYWASQNSREVDKSPIAQCEKHARHLYQRIYEYLPDGDPKYIIPLTVFVDKSKIIDSRNAEQKYYIPIAIMNNLKKKIFDYNIPYKYEIDINGVIEKMRKIGEGEFYR